MKSSRFARLSRVHLFAASVVTALVAGLPGTADAAFVIPASSGMYINAFCGDNPPMVVNPDGSVFHPGSGCGQRFNGTFPVATVDTITYRTGGIAAPFQICGYFVARDLTTGTSTRTNEICVVHSVPVTGVFNPPLVRTGAYTIVWQTGGGGTPSWADAHVYNHTGT